MKPMTVTVLVTTVLCIAITSVFLAIIFTIGVTENKDEIVAQIRSDFDIVDSILKELDDSEENDETGKEIGRRVLCGALLSTFGIFGIIGNIFSIIVFTRPSMRTGCYLIFSGKW